MAPNSLSLLSTYLNLWDLNKNASFFSIQNPSTTYYICKWHKRGVIGNSVLLKKRKKNLLRMSHCLNKNHYLYLASNLVIVTSFIEQEAPVTESNFLEGLLKMKAGCLGEGRVLSLLSMRWTANIVGRSTTSSCTHNNPTWMHLKTSSETHDSFIDESTISKALSSLHSSQTCVVGSIIYKKLYCKCKR